MGLIYSLEVIPARNRSSCDIILGNFSHTLLVSHAVFRTRMGEREAGKNREQEGGRRDEHRHDTETRYRQHGGHNRMLYGRCNVKSELDDIVKRVDERTSELPLDSKVSCPPAAFTLDTLVPPAGS